MQIDLRKTDRCVIGGIDGTSPSIAVAVPCIPKKKTLETAKRVKKNIRDRSRAILHDLLDLRAVRIAGLTDVEGRQRPGQGQPDRHVRHLPAGAHAPPEAEREGPRVRRWRGAQVARRVERLG